MGNLRSIIIVFILTACGIFIAGNAKAETPPHAVNMNDHIWDFRPTRTDHQLHMITSYAINYTLADYFKRNDWQNPHILAAILTMSLGLGEEAIDHSQGRGFSMSDVTANAIGTLAATYINYSIDF